jgi:hypothetical protein
VLQTIRTQNGREESDVRRGAGIAVTCVFRARTRLGAECRLGASAVEDQLASLRRRWSQFGLEALIRASGEAGGVTIHYRLTCSGHPDVDAVHTAFREDLDQALRGLAIAPPVSWDLDELARSDRRAAASAPALTYEPDDTDWGR